MRVDVPGAVGDAPKLHLALSGRRHVAVGVAALDGEDALGADFEVEDCVAEQDAAGDDRRARFARALHHQLLAHEHERHLVRPGGADDVRSLVGAVAVVENLAPGHVLLSLLAAARASSSSSSRVGATSQRSNDDGEGRLPGDEPIPSRVVRLHHEARAFASDGSVRPRALNLARGEANLLRSHVDVHRRPRQVHPVERHGQHVRANLRPAHRRHRARRPGRQLEGHGHGHRGRGDDADAEGFGSGHHPPELGFRHLDHDVGVRAAHERRLQGLDRQVPRDEGAVGDHELVLACGGPAVEPEPQPPDALAGAHEFQPVRAVAVVPHLDLALLPERTEQEALHGVAARAPRVAERVVGSHVDLARPTDDEAQVIDAGDEAVERAAGRGVQQRIPRLGQAHGVPGVPEHLVVVQHRGGVSTGLGLEGRGARSPGGGDLPAHPRGRVLVFPVRGHERGLQGAHSLLHRPRASSRSLVFVSRDWIFLLRVARAVGLDSCPRRLPVRAVRPRRVLAVVHRVSVGGSGDVREVRD